MKGTEDMPEPQTINYDQTLKLSQKFVDDSMSILSGLPYVEVNDMVKTILNSGYVLPISAINEIIQRISKYQYNLVKDFMNIIETNQGLYFSAIPIKQEPAPEQKPETEEKDEKKLD